MAFWPLGTPPLLPASRCLTIATPERGAAVAHAAADEDGDEDEQDEDEEEEAEEEATSLSVCKDK